jgi:TolA-binding protein
MNKKPVIPTALSTRILYTVLLVPFFLIAFVFNVSSQVPFTAKDVSDDFTRGMDLFRKEKYPAAIRFLDSYAENESPGSIRKTEAEYYSAIASLKLSGQDAEYRIRMFIANHHESPRLNEAGLSAGDYFYQNKNYRKAVTWYESVNRQDLDPDILPRYFFRLGYSLYATGDKNRALLMFSEIKDIDTEFTSAAVYYYSQIAYEQKMYQTALDGFVRLKKDETFSKLVPFYIIQILYLQKDYDGILSQAPELLNSAGKERSPELFRYIGDAHFNRENYKEALPYLEKYSSGAKAGGREDKYELAFCYFKTGNIDKAISLLTEIGTQNDLLTQNIWYALGDCYLQKGDKGRSRYAFGEASKLKFDKKITEEALFSYAKLTYETGYSPFGEAIEAFNQYIDQFPGSEKISEAYDYLIAAYMQLKNYKAALSSLDKIAVKDSRLQEAYQKVAFYRGLELFKNMEIEASADLFDKSLRYGKYNSSLRARALYWRGEAYYRLSEYEKSREDYENFMGIPGSMKLDEYKLVRYNLGYVMFNQKDYQDALLHFKAFESVSAGADRAVMADAWNRIADCYYITMNYALANNYYDKVIEIGGTDADYAMFRKGFSLGLMNNMKGKVDVLSSLITKYPSSSYVPEAIFERGRAYLVLKDFSKGEEDFISLTANYQTSPVVPRALVQLGLLYYNMGENEKSIGEYKKVIENFRSTPEARDAMTGLKNTYIYMNDVDSYFAYVKTLNGYGDVDMAQKDSLLYTSGENLYMNSKFDKATEVFKNYLNEFPGGSFRQNAMYYLAESLKASGNKEEALKLYIRLSGEANNQFLEHSLSEAASMFYDQEDYASSYDYYERLEKAAVNAENRQIALKGQLRSANQEGDAKKAIAAADKITGSSGMPEELLREAVFMRAKANYSLNNFDEALQDFRKAAVEVTSAEGAESKYRVAELLYRKDQPAESEKIINEFISQNSPHQYWMARMFLLLSDISLKKGDILQARATLQSLRDYYTVDNDGILDDVKARQDALNEKK